MYQIAGSASSIVSTFSANISSHLSTSLNANASESTILGAIDYKTIDYTRGYKTYKGIGKYYAKKSERWIACGSYYSQAGTFLRMNVNGLANNSTVATLEVTYYVQFRGLVY